MQFYQLEPEVAGGFGPNAVFSDVKARPPQVTKFNYEFDVWLGDPLLEAIGCFIITEPLRDKISMMCATGLLFGSVDISKSNQFVDRYPNRELPTFVWLQVIGAAGRDDFGLSATHSLVVSERILRTLNDAGMSHCDIMPFEEIKANVHH